MNTELIEKFNNRECKAKDIFRMMEVNKVTAYHFVARYHYLGVAKFFSVYNYGLFTKDYELVGVATFSNPQGTNTLKGWFGLDCNDKSVLELSRLCMLPALNGTNATSYLLSNSMKSLYKQHGIKAVITLADSSRHVGSIYQVCNFTYYGLSEPKNDFWSEGKKNVRRDTIVDIDGVWVPRPRKHRYAYIMDKSLKCLYAEAPRPNKDAVVPYSCCGGERKIYSPKRKLWFTCPICTGHLVLLNSESDDIAEAINREKSKQSQLTLF